MVLWYLMDLFYGPLIFNGSFLGPLLLRTPTGARGDPGAVAGDTGTYDHTLGLIGNCTKDNISI